MLCLVTLLLLNAPQLPLPFPQLILLIYQPLFQLPGSCAFLQLPLQRCFLPR
jgi:hypothetical protein